MLPHNDASDADDAYVDLTEPMRAFENSLNADLSAYVAKMRVDGLSDDSIDAFVETYNRLRPRWRADYRRRLENTIAAQRRLIQALSNWQPSPDARPN
jgi:hypothetical protein